MEYEFTLICKIPVFSYSIQHLLTQNFREQDKEEAGNMTLVMANLTNKTVLKWHTSHKTNDADSLNASRKRAYYIL